MEQANVESLKEAVEKLHRCKAHLTSTETIKESFKGDIVWEGVVSQFKIDHDRTDTCYAWSSPVEGSNNRKFYAVLKIPPIESALDAVRASIISDFKKE